MRRQFYQTNAGIHRIYDETVKAVDMREQYRDLILEAESSSMGYDFLVRLLSVKEEGKRVCRTEKLYKETCFEDRKRLEDIDYSLNQSLD